MTEFNKPMAAQDALERESSAWLNRLLSGAVSQEDAEAFTAWRRQSPAHDGAFVDAVRLHRTVRAAIEADRRQGAFRAGRARSGLHLSRRALIGGSIAASVAAYMVAKPPGQLWPSLAAMMSDYRTGTGQRRSLTPASGVSLALNTQTDVDLRPQGSMPGVELISGEAEVTVARPGAAPFAVGARGGRVLLAHGRVNVRNDGGSVCVTCIEGQAEVFRRDRRVTLQGGRQVVYDDAGLGQPAEANLAVVTGWRRGVLIFRDEPLEHVVAELNRYRPGRIILMDHALARRSVYGVFQLAEIDGAVAQVQRLTGAKATELPGAIVVLS